MSSADVDDPSQRDPELRAAIENAFAEYEKYPSTAALSAEIRDVLRSVNKNNKNNTPDKPLNVKQLVSAAMGILNGRKRKSRTQPIKELVEDIADEKEFKVERGHRGVTHRSRLLRKGNSLTFPRRKSSGLKQNQRSKRDTTGP